MTLPSKNPCSFLLTALIPTIIFFFSFFSFSFSFREEASEVPREYRPVSFETKALQHSKVSLTWDEDPHDRVLITKRKFTKEDLDNLEMDAYVASSGEDSDSDTDPTEKKSKMRDKYRSLLSEVAAEEEPNQEMEITFTSGLSEVATDLLAKKKEKEVASVSF
jgi:hypothetical protein